MTTKEKIIYLEKKFNAPLDIIIKAINLCNKKQISVKNIILNELNTFIKY